MSTLSSSSKPSSVSIFSVAYKQKTSKKHVLCFSCSKRHSLMFRADYPFLDPSMDELQIAKCTLTADRMCGIIVLLLAGKVSRLDFLGTWHKNNPPQNHLTTAPETNLILGSSSNPFESLARQIGSCSQVEVKSRKCSKQRHRIAFSWQWHIIPQLYLLTSLGKCSYSIYILLKFRQIQATKVISRRKSPLIFHLQWGQVRFPSITSMSALHTSKALHLSAEQLIWQTTWSHKTTLQDAINEGEDTIIYEAMI